MATTPTTPTLDQRALMTFGLGLVGLAVGLAADLWPISLVGLVAVLVGILRVVASLAPDDAG